MTRSGSTSLPVLLTSRPPPERATPAHPPGPELRHVQAQGCALRFASRRAGGTWNGTGTHVKPASQPTAPSAVSAPRSTPRAPVNGEVAPSIVREWLKDTDDGQRLCTEHDYTVPDKAIKCAERTPEAGNPPGRCRL